MHIDGTLIPLFALAVGLIITVTRILTDSISRYKLKAEQIKADAMVRAEEVRSRNELELEKLMRQDQAGSAGAAAYNNAYNNAGNNVGNSAGDNGFTLGSEDARSARSRVRE